MEPFRNASEIVFKEKFIERYSKLTDWELFKTASLSFPRRSIRTNTLKISISDLKKRLENNWKLDPIPWCKEAFWMEHHQKERRDIGNLPEHSLGYFYTQEAASLIPPIVLQPKEHELVLDMAAAPGSKSTQIAQYMNNRGILIANDYTPDRLRPLSMNLQRCGVSNVIITLMHGQAFKKTGLQFDKILLDAPCSGTGTIRKSLKTIGMWNPQMIERLAMTQKQLIDVAFTLLEPKGTLVYSTCSLEPQENEGVIDHLLQKNETAKMDMISLPQLVKADPILEFDGTNYSKEIAKTLRMWPQDNDTEGFFIAKIHKAA